MLFLGGFRSDMTGTKALYLSEQCSRSGQACTRFDYRGHGASSGAFTDGCIGDWADDALAILDRVVEGPAILVGSSMGGWIMLLVALKRLSRVKGLIGIAAAPDFTEDLIFAGLNAAQKAKLENNGRIDLPSPYGEPDPITQKLIDDGRQHLLLGNEIGLGCPVHLLQGQEDREVPWRTALNLAERISSRRVAIELIKDGDHRLSRDEDLLRLGRALGHMTDDVRAREA